MTTAKAAAILCICISASGCGRYADFALPQTTARDQAWPHWSEHSGPVMGRDGATDVLNPSVVHHGNGYYNFYSEYDGHVWHTALAHSSDGITWEERVRFLSPDSKTWEGHYIAANGTASYSDGAWRYWYVAGEEGRPQIGLDRSKDLKTWEKNPQPVLSPGPRGSFDESGVADPYVVKIGDWLYMYYLGENRARQQQIGLARSKDGVAWEKLRESPVLSISGAMDENGLGEPAVWEMNGWYWMLFTGRDAHENRSLGLARSTDGVHWFRSTEIIHGAETWDSKVVCDPTVVVDDGKVRVWFGGGDVASPDQNLHGQIGYGELKP